MSVFVLFHAAIDDYGHSIHYLLHTNDETLAKERVEKFNKILEISNIFSDKSDIQEAMNKFDVSLVKEYIDSGYDITKFPNSYEPVEQENFSPYTWIPFKS